MKIKEHEEKRETNGRDEDKQVMTEGRCDCKGEAGMDRCGEGKGRSGRY